MLIICQEICLATKTTDTFAPQEFSSVNKDLFLCLLQELFGSFSFLIKASVLELSFAKFQRFVLKTSDQSNAFKHKAFPTA